MIKLRTKTAKQIFNIRKKLIGSFIIYLIINRLEINSNSVTAYGNYFYVNNELEEINLTGTMTELPWETINSIETYILEPLNTETLKQAVLQRAVEFTFLQLEQENGENWATIATDWELVL